MAERLRTASRARRLYGLALAKYMLFLCESPECEEVASRHLLLEGPRELEFSTGRFVIDIRFPTLYTCLIALFVHSALIALCLFLAFLIIVRWKVARAASSFVVILCFVLFLSICNLAFWVSKIHYLLLPSIVGLGFDTVVSVFDPMCMFLVVAMFVIFLLVI